MITSLRLVDFKNFADETLRVGPFTVIVGANASGKSNIRDAFRFLHGVGRGYTLSEIVGGRFGRAARRNGSGSEAAIRSFGSIGQPSGIVWGSAGPTAVPRRSTAGAAFRLDLRLRFDEDEVQYLIEVGAWDKSSSQFFVTREELKVGSRDVFVTCRQESAAGSDACASEGTEDVKRVRIVEPRPLLLRMGPGEDGSSGEEISVDARQAALTQIPKHSAVAVDHRKRVERLIRLPGRPAVSGAGSVHDASAGAAGPDDAR